MNIAFLTTLNPADINNWSGTTFHLFHALSRKHHVKVIGQNTLPQAIVRYIISRKQKHSSLMDFF